MYELVLTLQQTPFGMAVSGPDPQRIVFLRNGPSPPGHRPSDGEPVWSSDELDLFVAPIASGVELKVTVHPPRKPLARTLVKAA